MHSLDVKNYKTKNAVTSGGEIEVISKGIPAIRIFFATVSSWIHSNG